MLQTDRLILRTWRPDDFEAYAEMSAEPEVTQFLAVDGKPLSRFAAWQGFCAVLGHWQLRGFGMFAVVERSSREFVGRVGPWHPEGWPGFEIGWTIRSKFWGRGYATEAARCSIAYAFNELHRYSVISLIDPDNVRSIKVAERVGEQLDGTVTLPDRPGKTILKYQANKISWSR